MRGVSETKTGGFTQSSSVYGQLKLGDLVEAKEHVMKKRRSALATASLILGITSFFLLLNRHPFPLLLAIVFGLAAVCFGAAGVWVVCRRRSELRGLGA